MSKIMSRDISMSEIMPDPEQPRQHFNENRLHELAQSMREKGLIMPIMIRPEGNRFIIVHGERRFRAAQELGWETIRAEVNDVPQSEAKWLALIENIQREDLSPIEEAQAYQERLNEGITQTELAHRIGKTQSVIAQKLRLLTLPDPIQLYLDRKAISEGHARQLLTLKKIYLDAPAMDFTPLQTMDKNRIKTDANAPGEFLRAIRVEDHPPIWFLGWEGTGGGLKFHDILRDGCFSFWEYAIKQNYKIPCWQVGAFWWACVFIELEISVADSSTALLSWKDRFYSALAMCNSGIDSEDNYGWLSDVRHAIRTTNKQEYRELFGAALFMLLKNNNYCAPSSMQPWARTDTASANLRQTVTQVQL